MANIRQINYDKQAKDTQVKFDANHSDLGATLEQKTEEGDWMLIAFASRYLNVQEKKILIK